MAYYEKLFKFTEPSRIEKIAKEAHTKSGRTLEEFLLINLNTAEKILMELYEKGKIKKVDYDTRKLELDWLKEDYNLK